MTREPIAPLYPRLLGAAWQSLHESVRAMHLVDGSCACSGRFRVRRAPGLLARAICRWTRIPPAGEDVETRVVVTGDARRERWTRSFAGHLLASESWADGDVLVEWTPPVELRFRLVAEGGALRFHQVGTTLCLAGLRLPLPAWCAPRVEADEVPAADGRGLRVRVAASAPLVGLLFEYEGVVLPEEGAA